MLQTATAGITTRVLILCVPGYTRLLINFGRAILRVVVHTDYLHGIFTFNFTDGPEASLQMAFLVVAYHYYRSQRLVTLESGQSLTRLVNHLLRHLTEGFAIDAQIFVVPICHREYSIYSSAKVQFIFVLSKKGAGNICTSYITLPFRSSYHLFFKNFRY